MREFDFYFLHHEVSALTEVITPPPMIIVCKEMADADALTLFSLNQALQYGSMGAIYFRSDVERIAKKAPPLRGGRTHFLIDDLAQPAHIGLFAARSIAPGLPRVSLSLSSSWSATAVEEAFNAMRKTIRSQAISVNQRGLPISVSTAAAAAIAAGDATTGDNELDDLVTNKRR